MELNGDKKRPGNDSSGKSDGEQGRQSSRKEPLSSGAQGDRSGGREGALGRQEAGEMK
jgi:hypothetical protein